VTFLAKLKPKIRKADAGALCPEQPLDTAGILLPSPICLPASDRKQMKNDIKFYNQPGADREDWYRLIIPDDEADPFIEIHGLITTLMDPWK